MSSNLSREAVLQLQKKYHYLINYESDDPAEPIDPLTYVDSSGDSLLHIAAQLGDIDTFAVLIAAGVDINQMGDMGYTALHYAHNSKNLDLVEFLLTCGASIEIANDFGRYAGE
jgi:ankyrin repeat protein